ncbi:MAG: DNA double-strand break repair nuclease NurA [Anaerolineales bacterium]|nr:DNA double-strand break repair nuclease NurA [Anaerolineales bacterium]
MTLELNQVAPQVKAMGQSLDKQITARKAAAEEAAALLTRFSSEFSALTERIARAERIQTKQRFDWVGAAPTSEALAQAYPLPPCPEQVTVIASDGSQILPDRHGITLYYLINVGSIIYRHGSNRKPEAYNPTPLLCYDPEELFDMQGQLISAGEVNVKRDMAEVAVLTELAARNAGSSEPIITLIDGQLTLRVIDLPFDQQQKCQDDYIALLNHLRESGALIAGYIDRPRSTFVVALLHLASLEPDTLTEEALRHNPFRHLTDTDLFDFLGPGERSAIFAVRAKGTEKYEYAGHGIHFFYLNVSLNPAAPNLVRVEAPAWLVNDSPALDCLHAAIVRQARINGGYPYVLARAHELAIISSEERQAVEVMLAVEMRRQGLTPALSAKQFNKTLLAGRESFRL